MIAVQTNTEEGAKKKVFANMAINSADSEKNTGKEDFSEENPKYERLTRRLF